jgi:hypothetical protein
MGSKLEYWFLLTKIAVVVLVMIEDGVGVVVPSLGRLVVDLLWHVGGGTFFYLPSKTRQFSKVQFPIRFGFWIFQFTKSPSRLPKIRPIANLLSSKLLWWKLENPKISQLPKNLPKISQFPIPLPKSNFQSPKIIQPERYCAGYRPISTIYTIMAYLNLSRESFKIK